MVLHVGGPRAAFSRVILLCRFQGWYLFKFRRRVWTESAVKSSPEAAENPSIPTCSANLFNVSTRATFCTRATVCSESSVNNGSRWKCLSTSMCPCWDNSLEECGEFGLRLTRVCLPVGEQDYQGSSANMYQSRHTVSENSCWNGGYCKTGSRNVTPLSQEELSNRLFPFLQTPHQPSGQPFKFTVADSCDRIKEEFNFLQAQYHR